MHVRMTDITNYLQQTPIFTLSLPPKPPTTNHSTILPTPTTPHQPTVDNPWTPHPLSAPHEIICTATTASDTHSVPPQNELHHYSTLLHPQSQFKTKTNQPNDAETQHKMCSSITHTVITTAVALTTACNTQPNTETYTRHHTTATSQAFRPPTDNASTFTTTAHPSATVLVAHLQCLFHPVMHHQRCSTEDSRPHTT